MLVMRTCTAAKFEHASRGASFIRYPTYFREISSGEKGNAVYIKLGQR